MKTKLGIALFVVSIFLALCVADAIHKLNVRDRHITEQQAYIFVLENQSIRERLVRIQNLVGAKPDGNCGKETVRLVNQAITREWQADANELSASCMTRTGAPE